MSSKKEKVLPDIMTTTVWGGRYVTSNFIHGRRIVLRGVGLALEVKNGKLKANGVVYPCLGPLGRLVKNNPTKTFFEWTGKKWKVTRLIGQ